MTEGYTRGGPDHDIRMIAPNEETLAGLLRRRGAEFVEQKADAEFERTGNLYLEVENNGRKSGIHVLPNDDDYLAVEFGQNQFLFLPKARWLELAFGYGYETRGGDFDRTKGFLISWGSIRKPSKRYRWPAELAVIDSPAPDLFT